MAEMIDTTLGICSVGFNETGKKVSFERPVSSRLLSG